MAGAFLFTAFFVLLSGSSAAEAMPPAAQTQPAASRAELQARLQKVSTDLFTRTDRTSEAIRELKAILAIDPGLAEAHMLLGIAYRGQGAPDMMGESVAELRQALALDPNLVPARLYLSYVYLDLGRVDRARDELQTALKAVPNQPQFLALLGEAERRLKNPARAAEVLQQALAVDPASAQARYYLGLTLLDLGRRQEGIAELERVVATGIGVADAYASLGAAYLEAGRPKQAIAVLTRGTDLDAVRPDLRVLLARAYRLTGLLVRADAQLKLAEPRVRTMVASSFAHQPQVEFDFLVEQGLLAASRGRLTSAAGILEKALELEPTHAATHREIAKVYTRLGDRKRAAEHEALAAGAGK